MSLLTEEVQTAQSDTWFAGRRDERFFNSDWVASEFSSAVSLKIRSGRLPASGQSVVLRAFNAIIARSFEVLPVSRENVRTAAQFTNRHELGLRGGDALHLAICEAHGADICTLDQRMMDAAVALGIGAVMPA